MSLSKIVSDHSLEEKIEGSAQGLIEFMLPFDDPINTGNHFCVERKLGPLYYAHHIVTVGIIRNTYSEVVLGIVHYFGDVANAAKELFSPRALMLGIQSLATVTFHTVSATKQRDGHGMLIGLTEKCDESGDILKSCLQGQMCRIRNTFYPMTPEDKLDAAVRAQEMVGEKSYRLISRNCEHFVMEILLDVAMSCQAQSKMFIAALIDNGTKLLHIGFTKAVTIVSRCLTQTATIFRQLPEMVGKREFYSLFSAGFDDALEPIFSFAFITGGQFRDIALRSLVDGGFTAVFELIAVIGQTVRDLYKYKHGKMSAKTTIQGLIVRISRALGAVLGTIAGGLLCSTLLLPFGCSPAGLVVGNIAGAVAGSVLGYYLGNKLLTEGTLERYLIRGLERWIKPTAPAIE